MEKNVKHAVRLLNEAGELYKYLGGKYLDENDPDNAKAYSQKAEECKEVAKALASGEDSGEDSAFVTRPKWLGTEKKDGRFLFELEEQGAEWVWKEAKTDEEFLSKGSNWCDAIKNVCNFSDEKNEEVFNPENIFFAYLPFLLGIRIVHITSVVHNSDDSESIIDAFFSLQEQGEGEEKTWEVKSFDFGSQVVHRLNGSQGLSIAGKETAYVRYFMHIVRGDDGAFRMIDKVLYEKIKEKLDNSNLSKDDKKASRDVLKILKDQPDLRFEGPSEDGGVLFRANILYSGAFFEASLKLLPDGRLDMLDDKPLADVFEVLKDG